MFGHKTRTVNCNGSYIVNIVGQLLFIQDRMFRLRPCSLLLVERLLLMLFAFRATSCLLTTPVDCVDVVNSSALFECSSYQAVIWSFRRSGQLTDTRIYVGGQPTGARYSVNRSSDNWYSLVISDLQLSDAGLYTCIDNDGFGPPASARLVVLDAPPNCGANVSANQPVLESQIIGFRCTLVYAGDSMPRVLWKSAATGVAVDSSEMSTRLSGGAVQLDSWIMVSANTTSVRAGPHRYTVTIFDDATSMPTYVWNSSSFVVLYAVRDVQVNVSSNDTIVVGETLHCRADGFPPADYQWTDVESGRTLTGPEFRLDAEGPHTYRCTATNMVSNVAYSAHCEVRVRVIRPIITDRRQQKTTVTGAVVIATITTVVIAALVVSGALLLYKVSLHRRLRRPQRRMSRLVASLNESASAISHQQVRACQSQTATADSINKRRDEAAAASCVYDSIDEHEVGYEQLPTAHSSPVATSLTHTSRVSLCWDPSCGGTQSAENDYLCVVSDADSETGPHRCCEMRDHSTVRYVQPLQQQHRHELYVNVGHATTSVSAAGFEDDTGVYLHTA